MDDYAEAAAVPTTVQLSSPGLGERSADEVREWQYDIAISNASTWLRDARVSLWLHRESKARTPRVAVSAISLFEVLAVQLAAALVSPFGVYRCGECKQPYTPEKRRPPRDGRAHYCPDCSEGASLAAKRRWWRENKAGKQAS